MKMKLYCLIGAVLLAVAIDMAAACSCMKAHKQQYFCDADFVMKVRVRNEEIVYRKEASSDNSKVIRRTPLSRKYFVKILKIFRRKENSTLITANSKAATLYTAYQGAACGRQLTTGNKYLITGYINGEKLNFGLCNWVATWTESELPSKLRRNLHHVYSANCDCPIKQRYSTTPEERSNKNKAFCLWNSFGPLADCYDKHTACIVNKNDAFGGCKWQRNQQLRTCSKIVKHRRWNP